MIGLEVEWKSEESGYNFPYGGSTKSMTRHIYIRKGESRLEITESEGNVLVSMLRSLGIGASAQRVYTNDDIERILLERTAPK